MTLRPSGFALAGVVLASVVLCAVWPGLLAAQQPDAVDPVDALAGPSVHHLFGTDQLGRDLFSRVVYGARPSLVIGFGAIGIALAVGTLLGVLAATGGRVLGGLIMRLTDVVIGIPGLLLALVVVAVLGPGTVNAMLAVGCSMTPGFLRLANGQAVVIRDSGYVRAAVTLGQSRAGIYLRHLLPNALPPLLVLAVVNVGGALIAGSSLSFLGLGPPAPSPEWGAMLSQGRDVLQSAWTIAVFPGLAVTATVISATVVGRCLQRRFEGRRPGVRR